MSNTMQIHIAMLCRARDEAATKPTHMVSIAIAD